MKRTILVIVVLIVAMLSVSAVSAQDPNANPGDQPGQPGDQPIGPGQGGPGQGGPGQGGPGQGGPGQGGPDQGWMADYQDEWDAAVADLLGITVEELQAAKEDGTRLEDLAEDLDVEEFRAAMDELFTSFLDRAVEDGVLTEEEAAQIAEHHAERGPDGSGQRGPGQGGPGQQPPQGDPGQQPPQGDPGQPPQDNPDSDL